MFCQLCKKDFLREHNAQKFCRPCAIKKRTTDKKAYKQTPKYKAWAKDYSKTPEYKERARLAYASKRKEYMQTPEYESVCMKRITRRKQKTTITAEERVKQLSRRREEYNRPESSRRERVHAYIKTPEYRAIQRKRKKVSVSNLDDRYVKYNLERQFKIEPTAINPDLIALKRQQILLRRGRLKLLEQLK